MPSAPQSGSTCMPPTDAGATLSRKRDDVTYQAMTVAAILLLLASLWVF